MDARAWERLVPEVLRELKRWVAYGPDPKTERPKCPLMLRKRDARASTRNPDTWGTFDTACLFVQKYGVSAERGVGFVFARGDGLVYVDVDDCLDEDGELRDWAKPFVEPFVSHAYIEFSPSRRGLHVICRATLPKDAFAGGQKSFPEHTSDWAKAKSKTPEVAVYAEGKYTTITADVWKGCRVVQAAQAAVDALWQAAGIHTRDASREWGAAPDEDDLPEVETKRVPKLVRHELQECTAADAPDRSAARFKLYADAAARLAPEEVFALVVTSDWYELSGAAEKGWSATWMDVCRCCSKALDAKKEMFDAKAGVKEDTKAAKVDWQALGARVTVEVSNSGPVYSAVRGVHNMALYFSKHPDWAGRIQFNRFKEAYYFRQKDGSLAPLKEEFLCDFAEAARTYYRWDCEPNLNTVWTALLRAGQEHAYHPVQDYLRSLVWDKMPRVDDWMVRIGCEDVESTRLVCPKWTISLVARALRPGCKVDNVLVLFGEEGLYKSTFFRTLAGGADYFSDACVSFDKDAQAIMHGAWIIELAELTTFQNAEQRRTQQFLTAQDLTFRPPYGKVTKTFPRHFVLTGSTNDYDYLTGTHGNRRYWPVTVVKQLDMDWVVANRDQLFAEAVVRFDAGEKWWFKSTPDVIRAKAEEHREKDVLEGMVAEYLAAHPGVDVSLQKLMEDCGLDITNYRLSRRLATAMRLVGYQREKDWSRGDDNTGGARGRWIWRPPAPKDGPDAEVIPMASRGEPWE